MSGDNGADAVGFNPKHPAQRADPYPVYAQLRAHCPLHYNADLDEHVVARHADIRRVLLDTATYSNERAQAFNPMATLPMLPTADDPAHGRQRRLIARAFTPAAVARLTPTIQLAADSLLETFGDAGRCNLMAVFAYPLPMQVLGKMFGIEHDSGDFRRWANDMMLVSTDPEGGMEAAMTAFLEFSEFILAQAARRKVELADGAAPTDELLSVLVSPDADGQALTEAEFVIASAQLLVAGHESTTNLIGNAVYHVLQRPDLARRLRADPAHVDAVIEEVLRFDSPVQGAWRRATRDVELCGHSIPAEDRLYLLYGSANRDERVFEQPDQFVPDRPAAERGQHLAFGHGKHICLGASLARREARIAVLSLLNQMPDLRLDDSRPIERSKSHFMNGFRDLPVRWGRP